MQNGKTCWLIVHGKPVENLEWKVGKRQLKLVLHVRVL